MFAKHTRIKNMLRIQMFTTKKLVFMKRLQNRKTRMTEAAILKTRMIEPEVRPTKLEGEVTG